LNLSNKGKVFLTVSIAVGSMIIASFLAFSYYAPGNQICESHNISSEKIMTDRSFMIFGSVMGDNNIAFNNKASLSSSGKYVYVVWVNTTNGHCDLLFTRSSNNGKTFEKTTILNDIREGSPINPHVTASDNNVYVMWSTTNKTESAEFFTSSSNNGKTFEKISKLNHTSPNYMN
jgi:hypothetical protein